MSAGVHSAAEWVSRIAANPETKHCLDEIDTELHTQLGELMAKATAVVARQAFLELRQALLELVNRTPEAYRAALRKALEAVDASAPDSTPDSVFARNPVETGTVYLFYFFQENCGLTGHRAQVCAARLRNAFWIEYGVKRIAYRPEYGGGQQSVGSSGIQRAVERYLKKHHGVPPRIDA